MIVSLSLCFYSLTWCSNPLRHDAASLFSFRFSLGGLFSFPLLFFSNCYLNSFVFFLSILTLTENKRFLGLINKMPVSLSNHQVPKLRAFIRGSSSCVVDPPDVSFSEAQHIADKSTTIIQEFRTNQISKSDAWFLLAKVFLSKSVPLLPLMEDFNTVETLLVCFFVPLALPLVLICLFFFFVFVALVFVFVCAIEAFLVVLLFSFPTSTTTSTTTKKNNSNSTPTTTDNTVL